jgi:hypothetical protein
MESIPVIFLTLLGLAGIFLAAVAGVIVLVAAVVIIAIRHRRNAVAPAEPAE